MSETVSSGSGPQPGRYGAWLWKVKSDKAWAKFLWSRSRRYFTIDFDARIIYYSHSENRRQRSQPIPFKDILGAEVLPPPLKASKKQSDGQACGFYLRTRAQTYELRTATSQHAQQWVKALNTARDIDSDLPSLCDSQLCTDEETCRNVLLKMPPTLRSDAAGKVGQAEWTRMSWRERLELIGLEANHSMEVRSALVVHSDPALPKFSRNFSAPLGSLSKLERLKTIFDTNDGLQVLVGHHLEHLVFNVIDAMRLKDIHAGEVLIRQGQESDSLYIVDEGAFDVLAQRGDGPPCHVSSYTGGMVFGELALHRSAPRAATIMASSPSKVWTLDRATFQAMLVAPEGTKTIGLVGGVMMLVNNLAGPTIVSMPGLAQESGWLSIVVVQVVVATFSVISGYMLLGAMRMMPGNQNFEQRIEFTNLAMFYLPRWACTMVMLCYHVNSILSLMSLIIQSGQVIDYLTLNTYGCTPGLALGLNFGYVCGMRTDSVTPFGDNMVVSSSMLVVGLICAPFAVKNLDDNVLLQYLAIVGLSVMAVIWVWLLAAEPAFPTPLPTVTTSQGSLIGTVLFNFAFTSTLPSWVNEKRPEVSVAWSFGLTMFYVVLVYSVVGIVGGMSYAPFYATDENLFSKLNQGGSTIGRATVTAYPMLQNFTSIPVFSILIRYNLIQSGIDPTSAFLVAVALPWVLSVPFYTGSGFDTISEIGGLATSSVINFIVPLVLYILARNRHESKFAKVD